MRTFFLRMMSDVFRCSRDVFRCSQLFSDVLSMPSIDHRYSVEILRFVQRIQGTCCTISVPAGAAKVKGGGDGEGDEARGGEGHYPCSPF